MSFYLHAKKLDLLSGRHWVALLNREEAKGFGIQAGDKINLKWPGKKLTIIANLTDHEVQRGTIGLYKDVWRNLPLKEDQIIEISFLTRPISIQAIKKKLLGKTLNWQEINSVVRDIANRTLGHTEIAYFVASGFMKDFSLKELYYLTKAVAENGECLRFRGKVVDKHSVGGIGGNRTTMIVVPILACFDIYLPKTSSRAITSPSGTADTMEVLAKVNFNTKEIKKMVQKNRACIVWGGGLNLAPADDRIVRVSYPLSLEPYSKMIVSIMAKKIASDVAYLVIDMPFGPTTKIPNLKMALMLEEKFLYLAKRFGIKTKVIKTLTHEPVGRGIGPALEARDVLRVLQQKEHRPSDLEKKSLMLAGELLEIAGLVKKGEGIIKAREILENGMAWKKMQKIIEAQGGNKNIEPDEVTLGAVKHYYQAVRSGKIIMINNKAVNDLCRILGAPADKLAGIYLNKRVGERVEKGSRLFTLYAQSKERMNLAQKALEKMRVFEIR